MIFKAGNRELNVKFSYMAVYRSGIVEKMFKMSELNELDNYEQLEATMGVVPELLLVGLQRYHRDEFGYQYESEDSKKQALEKVGDLIDIYFDDDNADFMQLFADLQEELVNNGFFRNLSEKAGKMTGETEIVNIQTSRKVKK